MDFARLRYFFSSFCVVSGSPVRPTDYNKYQMTLPMVNKSTKNDNNGNDNGTNDTNSIIDNNNNNNTNYFTGYLHYCCWPCVCDTEDFIHVDTLTIESKSRSKTVTGNTTITTIQKQQRYFAVIGNPCDHPEKLTEPFVEIFGRYSTTLSETAKEVRCSEDGRLLGATYSDHGYIILGMMLQDDDNDNENDDDDDSNNNNKDDALLVFDGTPTPGRITKNAHTNIQYHDQREYGPKCLDRAQQGYNSGMGEIFRKVCAISPIESSLSQLEESVVVLEKQDDNTTTSTFAIISTPHHDEKPQNDEL